MTLRNWLACLATICLLLTGGCRGYHAAPETSPFALPDAFSSKGGKASACNRWWQEFPDPRLWKIVDASLKDNFTIRSAFERIKMAQAIVQGSQAPLFPWLEAGSSLSHHTTREEGTYINRDEISLGATVSYEIDLWGRIGSGVKAARLDLAARQEDYHAALLSLSALVAEKYYEIVALKQERQFINNQIERNRTSLDIIREKYRFGQIDSLDLLQQKQLVEQNISKEIEVEKALSTAKKELAVLMGLPPDAGREMAIARCLPELPPLPAPGLPVEVIMRRPDCVRSLLELKAANARLAQAVSEQYPRLTLNGSFESDSSALKDLLENWIATIAANILVPAFEGGRLEAEVKLREARSWKLLYDYGQVLLEAIKEVEDSLEIERRQHKLVANLESRLAIARDTSRLLKERYVAGDVEYLRFLVSQINVDELERQLVLERLKLIKNRIRLYKAIAGPVNVSQNRQRIEADKSKVTK